jgi:hypothetical protein
MSVTTLWLPECTDPLPKQRRKCGCWISREERVESSRGVDSQTIVVEYLNDGNESASDIECSNEKKILQCGSTSLV